MGPFLVISPLPTPWMVLGGDGCLPPTGVPGSLLCEWSSFPSFFRLDVPLATTLEADVEASFFCYYLCATANAFTKALCFPASIFAKDKR